MRPVGKKVARGVKAGAKIVGGAVKKAVQWPGKQIEREMKMNKAKDKMYKVAGKSMNVAFSGKPTKRGTSNGYMVR